jgi:hypothetical protein
MKLPGIAGYVSPYILQSPVLEGSSVMPKTGMNLLKLSV